MDSQNDTALAYWSGSDRPAVTAIPSHRCRPRVLWTGDGRPRARAVLLAKAEVLELTGDWPAAEAIHRDDRERSSPGGREAAESALALAQLLVKRTCYDEARQLLADARAFFTGCADRRRLFDCLMANGQLLRRQGQTDASTADYDAGLAIVRALGDPGLESHALLELGINRYTLGDFAGAERAYREALALAPASDHGLRCRAANNIGIVLQQQGRYAEAREQFGYALEVVERMGDRLGQGQVMANLGSSFYYENDHTRALEMFGRYLAVSEALGDRRGVSHALGNLGTVLMETGDFRRALSYFERYLEIATELGDRRGQAVSHANLAGTLLKLGETADADGHCRRSLEISEQLRDRRGIAYSLSQLAEIRREQGDDDQARQLLERAVSISREIGLKFYLCQQLRDLAELVAARGDLSAALLLNAEALQVAGEGGRPDIVQACRILAATLSDDRRTAANDLLALLSEGLTGARLAEAHEALFRITGDESHRRAAAEQYRELLRAVPFNQYRRRLTALNGEQPPIGS